VDGSADATATPDAAGDGELAPVAAAELADGSTGPHADAMTRDRRTARRLPDRPGLDTRAE
jgi:hypothetical protein